MRQPATSLYIGATVVLALSTAVLAVVLPVGQVSWTWWQAGALLVAMLLTEAWGVSLPRGGSVSVATIPHIVAASMLPPTLALGISALAMLLVQAREHVALKRILFNVASTASTVALTALVAHRVGFAGQVLLPGSPLALVGFSLIVATYYVVNNLLVAGVLAVSENESLAAVLRANARVSAPAELAVAVVGGLVVFVWLNNEFWLPLVLFPAIICQLTFVYIAVSERRAAQLADLDALGRAVSAALTPREAFEVAWRQLGRARGLAGMHFWLEERSLDLAVGTSESGAARGLCNEMRRRVVQQDAPVYLEDAATEWHGGEVEARSWLALPLRGNAHAGGLGVAALEARAFTPEDRQFFEMVAERVALALDNMQLLADAAEADALRKLDQMKNELVSIVTHELLTPLTSMIGFAELLMTRDYPPQQRNQHLGVIHTEGHRLAALVHEFLDLQRMESGRDPLQLTAVDLGSIMERAVTASGIDPQRPVVVNLAPNLPPVLAQANRLQQVLSNLIGNARKYSPGGGEIRLTAEWVDDEARICVADQGLGIPPEAIPRLFEKFYRVPTADRETIKGTGLGLAICQQIVEAHGGRIWAESAGPGQGSRFFLTLPLAPSTELGPATDQVTATATSR